MSVVKILNYLLVLEYYCISTYYAFRGKVNMHGISNCTVNRISINISLHIKVVIWEDGNMTQKIVYTVNRNPVNRRFIVFVF